MAGRFKLRAKGKQMGKMSFDPRGAKTVPGRAECGRVDGGFNSPSSGKYTMTKANPRGADFVNREVKGTGPSGRTANDQLMGNVKGPGGPGSPDKTGF
jgi:hypothetical protein